MQKLYLISQCIAFKKDYACLHFRGYYRGILIKEVRVTELKKFILNEHYLIELRDIKVEKHILTGKVYRYKKLF